MGGGGSMIMPDQNQSNAKIHETKRASCKIVHILYNMRYSYLHEIPKHKQKNTPTHTQKPKTHTLWFGSVRFGPVRFGSVRFGSVRLGGVHFGVRGSFRFRSGCTFWPGSVFFPSWFHYYVSRKHIFTRAHLHRADASPRSAHGPPLLSLRPHHSGEPPSTQHGKTIFRLQTLP